MNKYQEALDGLKDTKCDEINNCKICSLVSYCGHYQCVKTLQELIDQQKQLTLEECIKEWEELGYKVLVSNDDSLILRNRNIGVEIYIEKLNKNYGKYDIGSCVYENFTFQEHQLLTKTFKMLGW